MKTLSIHRPSVSLRRRGFTLVELLVVIVIIAILAGLAFPAFSGVLTSGKKARAAAMCNQLATGMQAYYTEYNRWPAIGSSGLISSDAQLSTLATALNGGRTLGASSGGSADDTHNARLITFMSFSKKDYTSSSGEETYPVNPWDNIYYIQFDHDYDNYLEGLPAKGEAPSGGSIGLSSDVAVWTADDSTTAGEVVANSYE